MEQAARSFAAREYGSAEELEHPAEVAGLVRDAGGDEVAVAAAWLHDVVEDTDATLASVRAEFGDGVAAIVAAMTENDAIEDYAERKAEARLRARDGGRETALVFVADKLSNARRMHRGKKEPDPKKLAHYRASLELMRAELPDLPLLSELEAELER